MKKLGFYALGTLAFLFTFLLLSSVSASIWEPKYEAYKLGAASHAAGSYNSVETYEKVVVENEDRFGSDKTVSIKRTESETFVPERRTDTRRVYVEDRRNYDTPRYRYTDSLGRGRDRIVKEDVVYGNVFIHYDDAYYPSTNWRFKESYRTFDYPKENEYGYKYYYAPRYDWHRDVYNWRY